jgi:uncharacterized protein (TIGR02271 family)
MSAERTDPETEALPIVEETLSVERRRVPTGRVRVRTVTDRIEAVVEAALARSEVEVTRVPIDREIDTIPEVRTEGDTVIVPVVEEVPVVTKRLVLREEVHIRRLRQEETLELPVQLRKQRAVVTREEPDPEPKGKDKMADDSYGGRTLTAFFDSRTDAEEAMARLTALGLSDVRLTGGDEYAGRTDVGSDRSVWESISDFFFPPEDRATYAEGLRRGGYLLTVRDVPGGLYDQVLDILDDEGSVDLDERAETWRTEGWNATSPDAAAGYGVGSAGATGSVTRTDEVTAGLADAPMGEESRYTEEAPAGGGIAATVGGGIAATGGTRATGDEEVIPVVQESLRVGKRDVNLGRVRVRSYVVEEPISEDVTLREERVEVERRPVDRAISGTEAAFTDRTIEAEEHAEEAIVSKDARVVEEVALRRQSEDRTETVSDTVRRTEVEVEDDRDATGRTVPGQTPPRR